MRNVKIYSMSLSEEIITKIDNICSECGKMGCFVTRSHVIGTLLESACTNDKNAVAWINYFRAENEYNQMVKRQMKRSKKEC